MACAACSKEAEGSETFQQCSRCKQASYCSRDCQTSHWETHKASCKRPNYVLKFDLSPASISDRLRAVISDPPVSRTLSCPSTATFHQLHEALQVAFGWASTHTYDFNVLDSEFDTTQDDSSDAMMAMVRQMTQGMSASDPREYVLRMKDDRRDPTLNMVHVDRMHDRNRQHPRTKEKSGLTTKLFQVLDAPEYRNERIVYTYDFGDRWEHTLTVVRRAPSSSTFTCTDGSGHGVAEDVTQDGWEPLVEAYRSSRPNKEQREKIRWYERTCSNPDRLGLSNGRENLWDKAAINDNLARVKCS